MIKDKAPAKTYHWGDEAGLYEAGPPEAHMIKGKAPAYCPEIAAWITSLFSSRKEKTLAASQTNKSTSEKRINLPKKTSLKVQKNPELAK